MDVAQLYAENELFCLDKSLTKRKREQIVNTFLSLEQQGALGLGQEGLDEYDDGASGSGSKSDDRKKRRGGGTRSKVSV